MTGLEKNLRRLFRPNGKTLWVALDHPQFCGPMPGLENPIQTIGRILLAPHDGMILNPGIFRFLPTEAYQKRLVMRVSVGGTCFSDYSKVHPVVVDPVQTLCEGADAVIMMLILGSQDALAMESVRRHIEAYHRYAIPVVVEVMSEDYTLNNDFQHVYAGARIAAELGCDIVKVFYCEGFHRVVETCPVPVLLAGGPKDADVLEGAKEALRSGAKGFAFGRNVFQNENPVEMIDRLSRLLEG
ncbi:MAG TPA: hypothetical protein PLB79_06665 [Thermotogota bacterium]|nr:hypothetical protein [Thermotogota bacterium]